MQPVRATKNQYRGINAHLHSMWQGEGGWKAFHAAHIIDLDRKLKTELFPLGYITETEDSLQIRRSDPSDKNPESDITIYDSDPVRALSPVQSNIMVAAHTEVMSIVDVVSEVEELSEYQAIAIYVPKHKRKPEQPVAWIELLSPSNKLQDLALYQRKRLDLLKSGIVFIELDYLHESPPTFHRIANYATWRKKQPLETNAHPYRIVVCDPRPNLRYGRVYHYPFDVDETIPIVTIPLNGNDQLAFDFTTPYHKTLEESIFAYQYVDYRRLPQNLDRYSPADQQRILNRMLAVLEAAQAGVNLENAPLPVQNIPLGEVQIRVAKLGVEFSPVGKGAP